MRADRPSRDGLTRLALALTKASGYAAALYGAWKVGQGIEETGQIAAGTHLAGVSVDTLRCRGKRIAA